MGVHHGRGRVRRRRGETLAFTAAAKDAYGNPADDAALLADATLEIFRDGDAPYVAGGGVVNATATISDPSNGGGALDATYVVEETGTYWLVARVRGTLVRGAPFALDVSRRPAPVAVSAVVADALTHVNVVFDVDTDKGGPGANGCASFLDAATVAALGTDASCVWRDAKTLAAYFGPDATRRAGDVVGIRTGALKNAARNSHDVTGEVVAPPNRAERPVAVLSAPDALGPCDGGARRVGIDGGGRPMTYAFSVAADATDGYAVTSALDAAHAALGDAASVVALAPEHLDPGVTYVLPFASRISRADVVGVAVVNKTQHPCRRFARSAGLARDAAIRTDAAGGGGARAQSRVRGVERVGRRREMSFAWTLVGDPCSSRPIFPRRRRATRTSPRRERARCTCRQTSFARGDVPLATQDDARRQPRAIFHGYVCHVGRRVESLRVAAAGTSVVAFHNAPLVLSVDARDPDDAADARGVPYPFTYAWSCATPTGDACDVNPAASRVVHSSASTVTFPSGRFTRGRVRLHRERRARTRRRRT